MEELPLKKNALITGASSGLGREFAEIFAREGYDLILVARRERELISLAEELERGYGTASQVISLDLSLATSANDLFNQVIEKGLFIDVLVNNAGFGVYGPFDKNELDDVVNMLEVNVLTLTKLTRLVLPAMLEARKGKILNVASTAAFQPIPLFAAYAASKSYVLSVSEALANELQGTGVTVTALCPGATKTEFGTRSQMNNTRLFGKGVMDAKTVAELGFKALKQGKSVVITGVKNRMIAITTRFAPRKVILSIAKSLMK